MYNERLDSYLETLNKYRISEWHQRSTNDHLVRLETFIRQAFIKKKHFIAGVLILRRLMNTT